jgi:thiopeptide-type bacteriocin biosynthesis protein
MVSPGTTTPYYRPGGAAIWRASVHGPGLHLPPWPDAAGQAGPWESWLAVVWTHRSVVEAITAASPVLADRIEQTLAGHPSQTAQVSRMVLSLARYLIRLRGRATPFGTFAGVGTAGFGERAELVWSEEHRVVTRADAGWLAAVIALLEGCPPLLGRLPVVVNDLAFERAGRLVVPWQPHLCALGQGRQGAAGTSVRLVPVVRTIQQAARCPIEVSDLIGKVVAEHAGVARQALLAAVAELVSCGVLISSLRAPSTVTDPLAHLLARLDEAGAAGLPESRGLVAELSAISGEMKELHTTGTWHRAQRRRVTQGRMRALAAVDQPLISDLRLGGTLTLPHTVAQEAAAAGEALIRLSATAVSVSWGDYHCRFLGRYGPGTLVPLADLVDPVTGLGFPAHFTPPSGPGRATPRDQALLALAQQAALDGADEIALDPAALDALAPEDGRRPVIGADLWADLRAASTDALTRGDFTLGVCGFGRSGATTGRFLDLLDSDGKQHGALHAATPGVEGALLAQLSFPPPGPRSENVLRVRPVLPHVVPLAEHREPSEAHIPVGDLAVVADAARLYVVSRSRRQVVEAVLPHAGARHTMPPLARLLFEIPRSTHPAVAAFDWGIASCLPYLPRIRYGRSVLAPVQWRLNPAVLPNPQAPTSVWDEAVDRLRDERGLPGVVAVGAGDRRMRLDLGEPIDRAVLRAHLAAASGPVTIAEAPAAAEYGWIGGRAHEIVIPLAATAPPDPAPAVLSGTAPLPVPADGAGVVYARLHAHPEALDAILTRHLPDLLEQWEAPPRWWFVRYLLPSSHLRLRLHDVDHAQAAGRIAAWADGLRQRGLVGEVVFDAYRPETGRYGPGTAMDAAEALFAADSAAALAQLSFLAGARDVAPQALAAASLLDLAGAVLGTPSSADVWLLAHPAYAAGAPAQDREMRRQTMSLTTPRVLPDMPGGDQVAAAWTARATAAAVYTARLAPEATRHTPETVLGSLLHLHHVRALGPDPQSEAVTFKLARAVALTRTAPRRKGGQR